MDEDAFKVVSLGSFSYDRAASEQHALGCNDIVSIPD